MTQKLEHQPVLVKELLAHFQPKRGDTLLDATVGLGGHAAAYLQAVGADSATVPSSQRWMVVALDADSNALEEAKKRLAAYQALVIYIHSSFARLPQALDGAGINSDRATPPFTHILFDLGIGSHQLSDEKRGFSYRSGGPLSMRYGQTEYLPPADVEVLNMLERRLNIYPDALDIINGSSIGQLAELIGKYGEERHSRLIAGAIKEKLSPTATAAELAEVIVQTVPSNYERGRIHPATRTFQALRLAVNRELESLRAALPQAVGVLKPAGLIAVISFHSLEDRIVKHFFRQETKDCLQIPPELICTCNHQASLEIITKRPIEATAEEVSRNPRARSAKLRVAMRKE